MKRKKKKLTEQELMKKVNSYVRWVAKSNSNRHALLLARKNKPRIYKLIIKILKERGCKRPRAIFRAIRLSLQNVSKREVMRFIKSGDGLPYQIWKL